MTPESLKIHFSEILGQEINNVQKLTGGCSYPSYLLTCTDEQYFIKTHEHSTEVFNKEVTGLKRLKQFGAPVPEVIAFDSTSLVLSYIEPTTPTPKFWVHLAKALADLHKAKGSHFGFSEDNFIGLAPQKNICPPKTSWSDFFWNYRILFKIEEIEKKGSLFLTDEQIQKLEAACKSLLTSHCPNPSPLHGDLWNGNILCGANEKAYLIDPAFYFGDRETDLAMTECFGGFDPLFYETYNSEYPLKEGYENRKHLYNLYHMLNHQFIFGDQYKGAVASIVTQLIEKK